VSGLALTGSAVISVIESIQAESFLEGCRG
jgi:hypothetical protein